MATLRVAGTLSFAGKKKIEAALAAFDARRYVEFADRADFVLGRDVLTIDVDKDVEVDCLDNFHDAYVALAQGAVAGFVDLVEKRRTRRAYAGGHLVFVRDPETVAGRIVARQLEWRDEDKPLGLPTPSAIQTFAVAPEGERIAISGGPQGGVGGDGALPKYLKSSLKYVDARDWAVVLFDAATGREAMRCFGPRWVAGAVAFSPDGARFAAGSADEHVYVWDARSGRRFHKKKAHAGGALAVAWTGDGARLLTGRADGVVRVWESAAMAEIEAHPGRGRPRAEELAKHGGVVGANAGFRQVDRGRIERVPG